MKIGTDLVEIKRFDNIDDNKKHQIFADEEVLYANKTNYGAEHFAGFYASKEAFLKALGTGIESRKDFLNIIVCHNEKNAPIFKFLNEFSIYNNKVKLSISHDGGVAVAFVIIEE